MNQNTISISASNDYENTIIEIKRLLRPFPAVRFRSSIKTQFHVQISKIMQCDFCKMGRAWFIKVDQIYSWC